MTILTNPIFLTKIKLQTSPDYQSTSFVKGVSKIYQLEGIKGFYRGIWVSLPLSFHGALHWTFFEYFKKVSATYMKHDFWDSSSFETFGLAATSKLIAASITYPLQTIKTIQQVNLFVLCRENSF